MKTFILVFIAGGLGSALRFGVGQFLFFKNYVAANAFPLPTFVVNIIGSFLIGLIMAYAVKNENFNTDYKIILVTGFCGGFTTFSALSNETFLMLKQNNIMGACVYIFLSVVVGIFATYIGYKCFLT